MLSWRAGLCQAAHVFEEQLTAGIRKDDLLPEHADKRPRFRFNARNVACHPGPARWQAL